MPNIIRGHIKYPAKQAAPKVEVVRVPVKGWTDEEDDYPRKHYQFDGTASVSAALGRTRGAVQARASVIGITAPKYLLRA